MEGLRTSRKESQKEELIAAARAAAIIEKPELRNADVPVFLLYTYSRSSVISMYLDIGVKLLTAWSSMPTRTLVSGK